MLLLLAAAATTLAIRNQALAENTASLTVFIGNVDVHHPGSGPAQHGSTGEALAQGDEVVTGPDSRAAIDFPGGSVARLDAGTSLTITTLTQNSTGGVTVQLSQSLGRTWNRVAQLAGGGAYKVTTPNNSTAEVRGTTYVVTVSAKKDGTRTTQVDTISGAVDLKSSGKTVSVPAGTTSQVETGSAPTPPAPIATVSKQDPFTLFNSAVDASPKGSKPGPSGGSSMAQGESAGGPVGGADGNHDMTVTVSWPGSTMSAVIIGPNGASLGGGQSSTPPLSVTAIHVPAGSTYIVTCVECAAHEPFYVVVSSTRSAPAATAVPESTTTTSSNQTGGEPSPTPKSRPNSSPTATSIPAPSCSLVAGTVCDVSEVPLCPVAIQCELPTGSVCAAATSGNGLFVCGKPRPCVSATAAADCAVPPGCDSGDGGIDTTTVAISSKCKPLPVVVAPPVAVTPDPTPVAVSTPAGCPAGDLELLLGSICLKHPGKVGDPGSRGGPVTTPISLPSDKLPPVVDFKPPPEPKGPPIDVRPPIDIKGPPTDVRGPPIDVKPPPVDVRPPPVDFQPPPVDVRPPPVDVEPPPVDFRPPPVDFRPPPVDVRPPPVDVQPPPVDVRPPPVDVRPPPVDVQPPPVEVRPPPVDVHPPPVDVHPPPVDVHPPPVDVHPPPVDVHPPPVDVHPPPVEVRPPPVELPKPPPVIVPTIPAPPPTPDKTHGGPPIKFCPPWKSNC